MRRALLRVGWGLLAGLVALLAMLAGVVGTESGSRWVLGQLPAVEVERFSGRLGGDWEAIGLVLKQPRQTVRVEGLLVRWRPSCLMHLLVCVEHAEAHGVSVERNPDVRPKDDAPLQLPTVRLPVGLDIRQLLLTQVTLDNQPLFDQVTVRGRSTAEGIAIDALQLDALGASAAFSGVLKPEGGWPLALSGEVRLPAVDKRAWSLRVQARGELRDRLSLEVSSQGYIDGALSGTLRPLRPGVPAQLLLTAADFKLWNDSAGTLTLDTVAVALQGDLLQGYQLGAAATVPARQGTVAGQFRGVLRADGLDVDRFEVRVDERFVRLQGVLGWRARLAADLTVQWVDFPWQQFYRPEAPVPIDLRKLTGQVQYEDGNYLGHFNARLVGPAGEFSLASPFSGSHESLYLPQFELLAGQGRAGGTLGVALSTPLAWTARMAIRDLDPAYWIEQLPGTLSGQLDTEGRFADGALQADADLALDGRLRGQAAQLAVRGSLTAGDWDLTALNLRVGDNRVSGRGRWGQRLEGRLDVRLKRLAQLWPGLGGQAEGHLALSGTPDAPAGDVTLNATGLRYDGLKVSTATFNASLVDGRRGAIRLHAQGLHRSGQEWGTLRLDASGTAAQHDAQVRLAGTDHLLAFALTGAASGSEWHGLLARGTVQVLDQRWMLEAPVALERHTDGRVMVGGHCWLSAPATLCAKRQPVYPEVRLAYALRNLPVDRVSRFFPESLAFDARLAADLSLHLGADGPAGSLRAGTGAGTIRLRKGANWQAFAYQDMSMHAELAPGALAFKGQFLGGGLGELTVELRTDPRIPHKPLTGSLRLASLDLSALSFLAPGIDGLAGRVSGRGELDGTLRDPLLRGQLRLSDGQIAGERLPVHLQQVQLVASVDGRQGSLEGSWVSGERGIGRLRGTIGWREVLAVDLRVEGQNLPIAVEPFAHLEADPTLNIRLHNQRLNIVGQVRVPRGEIQLRELPASTVRISPDTVIVGEEPPASRQPVPVNMNVVIEVGQERVRFRGLGLTADLAGRLHVGDELTTRGELVLLNGRYRAYGQRLTLRRARLLFTGRLGEPFLDVEAIRRVERDDVTAGLRITGSVREPLVKVFAEPAMSEEQALSYLVLGRTPGAGTEDSSLLAQAALGLGLSRSANFTGRVADRLGIDNLQLETEGTGADTAVVARGDLTERLSFRYGVGVFEAGNTIALRYQLTRRVFLEAASGLADSLDLFYRRDF